jgi:hypothetical protein
VRVRRLLSVFAVACIAAGVLTGCQSNVGAAAFVGKSRISESDVNHYLTANAAPYTTTDSNGQSTTINPKSEVLSLIIADRLFTAAFKTAPGGPPSASALSASRATVLGQTSLTEAQLIQSVAADGYKGAYASFYITVHAEFVILETQLKDTGDGSIVLAAIAKLKMPVRVSPRYGAWESGELALDNGPILPSFLEIKSVPAPAATPAADGS